jgi:hypothetical protein
MARSCTNAKRLSILWDTIIPIGTADVITTSGPIYELSHYSPTKWARYDMVSMAYRDALTLTTWIE